MGQSRLQKTTSPLFPPSILTYLFPDAITGDFIWSLYYKSLSDSFAIDTTLF